MITKNFKNWINALATYNTVVGSNTLTITLPYFKDVAGTLQNKITCSSGFSGSYINAGGQGLILCPNNSLTYNTSVWSDYYSSGTSLWVGSSTADESEEDFDIVPIADTDLTSTAFTAQRTFSDGKIVLQINRTLKNQTADAISINEVALLQVCPTNSWVNNAMYLFDRRLLQTPIVLGAAGTDTDTHTFTMVYEF